MSHRPDLPWTFTIVDVPAVNAFALPGGYIYVTRGLLAHLDDESELAGVLGHEMGHVTARHASQQYTRSAGGGLGVLLPASSCPACGPSAIWPRPAWAPCSSSTAATTNSNPIGWAWSTPSKAGWDPDERAALPRDAVAARCDERARRAQLAVHASRSRVARGEGGARGRRPSPTARASATATTSCGASTAWPSATNRPEGVVRGHQFLHPDLRIAVEFPEGWDVQNSSEQVVAQPDGEQDADADAGGRRACAAPRLADGAQRAHEGARLHVRERRACSGERPRRLRGRLSRQGEGRRRGAHPRRAHRRRAARSTWWPGVAPEAEFARVDADFTAALRVVPRADRRAKPSAIRPNRLGLYDVEGRRLVAVDRPARRPRASCRRRAWRS